MMLTASLGNLVLIIHGSNDRARNDEYARKNDVNVASRFDRKLLSIIMNVLTNEELCPKEIRQREVKLVSLLNHIWRLNIETAQLDEKVN